MAFEMPLDQIKQLQILLRKEANLSWYQPENEENPALPKLPSVTETIAKLDPSPPYLRCKNCNGRLIRDLQSSICVFCGTNPHKDLPPEPIKFKNTIGYRWLLESLDLDGSEMVAAVVEEENGSNRGRSELKDEIPLSELLDLEIRWPSEAERTPLNNSDSAAFQGKGSLNLAGIELDSFFYRREPDSVVVEQNLTSAKEVGTASDNTFQANENLSLFQNVQVPEVATGSAGSQSGDSFSGWEANFMAGSSGAVHQESKSVEYSKDELDTVSGYSRDSVGVKKNDDFNSSASSDWFHGDGLRTSNTDVQSQTRKTESTMDLNDTKTAESVNGSFTRNFDWMQHDQWKQSDKKTADTVAADEAEDSFDSWNDFTGSGSTQDPSSITSGSKMTDQIGKSGISADVNDTKTAESGDGSSSKKFDWMKDDQWQGSGIKTTDTVPTDEADDSFDAWNDFTGSASIQDPSSITSSSMIPEPTGNSADFNDTKTAEGADGSSNKNFDWMLDDQWHNNNNKRTNTISTDAAADSFDAWNDFTGSSNIQYSSSSLSNSEITGQTGNFELTKDPNGTKTAESATASSRNFDWMQDDQWQGSNNATTNEVTDSFDAWDDFTGLSISQNPTSNVSNSVLTAQTGKFEITADLNDTKTAEGANTSGKSFDWMRDDQWQVSNKKTTDTMNTNDIADSFEVWNGFSSSATTQDPSSNVWEQTVNQTSTEKTSDTNLLSSSNKSNDLDFSVFSYHDLFSGLSSAATTAQPAAASTNRVAEVDTTRGNSGDVSTAVGSKDDVEMLKSQMHDLSFMLENNLSFPPK